MSPTIQPPSDAPLRGPGSAPAADGTDSFAAELALSPQELRELVCRDELTGLFNRRYLYPYVERHLRALPAGPPLALLMIDLDHFKAVNDTHGHVAGDAVLRQLAERFGRASRRDDRLVRFAGDEFMILMPGTSKNEAARLADRFRRAVAGEPFDLGYAGRSTRLSVSIGVAEAPVDATSVRELIEAADRALYVAKEAGRDRVAVAGEAAAETPHLGDLLAGFPCPTFVGRRNELARCEALSHLGERGPPTLTIVQGEGGIGKGRLLREIARRRASEGALTLWISCREELRTSPYAALTNVLRRACRERPEVCGSLAQRLDSDERAALARRIPELAEGAPPTEPVADVAWRSRLFSSVLVALRCLGREHGLCLFIDNIQHADAATLKVLVFLLRHERQDAAGATLPVYATLATDVLAAMEGPETAWGAFRRFAEGCPTVGTVELDCFGPAEVAAMVAGSFPGHRFPADFADKIHRVTRGSPLFVEEVLILLVLGGFIVLKGGTWQIERTAKLTLPDNMNEILVQHLGRLDEETADAVLKASVIGSEFSVDLLHKVLEINEGHAAQLTDRAIRYRLLDQGNPATMEDIRFVNRRLRDLTYEIVGEDVRKDLHGKVATLREHFEVVDLDDALSEIAFHHELEGEPRRSSSSRARQVEEARRLFRNEEGEAYFDVVGKFVAPRIETRIAEATLPLKDEQVATLPVLMKDLVTVRRGVQMYPAGSRYITQAVAALLADARGILEQVESFTLKERAGEIEVNSRRYDMDTWGPVGGQIVEMLRSARVHSVTFNRAVSAADIESLGHGLLAFARDRPTAPAPDEGEALDWDAYLSARTCRGIGVVPKRFKATAGGERQLAEGSQLEGLARDSALHAPILKDILRFTAATAEAILLYPEGSDTLKRALQGLEAALAVAHGSLSSVNLGVTNDGFLINDLRLDVRTFGPGVVMMRDLLARAGTRSISFHRGVEGREIEALFRYLEAKRPEGEDELAWPERLARHGVHRVGIDEYVFVAADAQGGAEEGGSEDDTELIRLDRETFLRKVLECDPGDLLGARFRSALPDLLTELVLDGDADQSRQVVSRIFANMEAPEPHLRVSAMDVVQELLTSTSRVIAREIRSHCTQYVAQALRSERSPAPLGRLVSLAAHVAEQHLRKGDLREASRIMWLLGKGLQADVQVDEESRRGSAQAIRRLTQSEDFERALAALWSPNEKRRALALHLIESCGRQASDRLLQLAVDSGEASIRRIHAEQLKAVGGAQIDEKLARLVTPYEPAGRVQRAIEVLEFLGCDPVPILVRSYMHPSPLVTEAADALVRRLPAEQAGRVVEHLARSPERRLRERAVELAAQATTPEAVREMERLATARDEPVGLRVKACAALGRCGWRAGECGRLKRDVAEAPSAGRADKVEYPAASKGLV